MRLIGRRRAFCLAKAQWHDDRAEDLRSGHTLGLMEDEVKRLLADHAQRAAEWRETALRAGWR